MDISMNRKRIKPRSSQERMQRLKRLAVTSLIAVSSLAAMGQSQTQGHRSASGRFDLDAIRDGIIEKDLKQYISGGANYQYDTTFRQQEGFLRGTEAEKADMQKAVDRLVQVPEGKALVDSLKKWDVSLSIDSTRNRGGGAYFQAENHIFVGPHAEEAALVEVIAHEATHASQDARGLLNRENMSLEENVSLTRFIEADACAHAVLAAWQLREKDDSAVFNTFASSELYEALCNTVLEKEAGSKKALSDKEVLEAAFEGWFKDESLRGGYDWRSTLKNADIILNASPEEVRQTYDDKKDLDSILMEICVTQEGETYLQSPDKYQNHPYRGWDEMEDYSAMHLDFLDRRVDKIQAMENQTEDKKLKEYTPPEKEQKSLTPSDIMKRNQLNKTR